MQSRHSDFKRKMVLFALMVLVVALVASTAFAHTGLSSSSPAEGQAVDGPFDTISLSTAAPLAPGSGDASSGDGVTQIGRLLMFPAAIVTAVLVAASDPLIRRL